jgi:phosphatidylinositol-3-phosphatase
MRFAIDKFLSSTAKKIFTLLALLALSVSLQVATRLAFSQQPIPPKKLIWPQGLPVYDHVMIVVEENKNFDQIVGSENARYINSVLVKQGATLTQMYAEEHHSQGNYFWLFSGSNQHVGYLDEVPHVSFSTSNLGEELIRSGHSFKGYSEGLPEIGSTVAREGLYVRKHIPWISFSNVPNGATIADSSNLRFPQDFPSDYNLLPTVFFVTANSVNDMHDGPAPAGVLAGDKWLQEHIDGYYEWAKRNNSLLILTFDENDDYSLFGGLTNPGDRNPNKRNRIVTILAGAHIKPGEYAEGRGVNHVSVLRTLEAMYKLDRSGSQEWNALKAGIGDDVVIKDIFDSAP